VNREPLNLGIKEAFNGDSSQIFTKAHRLKFLFFIYNKHPFRSAQSWDIHTINANIHESNFIYTPYLQVARAIQAREQSLMFRYQENSEILNNALTETELM